MSVPLDGGEPTSRRRRRTAQPGRPVSLKRLHVRRVGGFGDASSATAPATPNDVDATDRRRRGLDAADLPRQPRRDRPQRRRRRRRLDGQTTACSASTTGTTSPRPRARPENEEQTTEETVETTLPERTEKNTPPIAKDDDFGVRPGRTTVLPVLDNDTDADGDVLAATLPEAQPVDRHGAADQQRRRAADRGAEKATGRRLVRLRGRRRPRAATDTATVTPDGARLGRQRARPCRSA